MVTIFASSSIGQWVSISEVLFPIKGIFISSAWLYI